MFGGIILGFTRNVAENDNPNEVQFGLKTFGFNPLERTGWEWNFQAVDEVIFEEYGHNGSQGIINACWPENHEENIQNENVNGEMEWKRFRPSIIYKYWLRAWLERSFSASVFLLSSQISLAGSTEGLVAAKIQWSKTIFECIETVFIHFWLSVTLSLCHIFGFLFLFRSYQIMGLKGNVSWYLTFSTF